MSPETKLAARTNRSVRLRGTGARVDAGPGRLVVRFVGRAAQMDQFLAAVSEDPRSSARIVGVSGAPGAGKTRFVEEALAQLVRVGRPVTVVRPAIGPGLEGATWLRAFAAKLALGGPMLSGAVSRFAQDPAARLDESSARALVNAFFHENYDCGVERRGFISPKFQRLAIVLDDFDLLSGGIAVWLAETFLPRLDEVRAHLDYVLILVGSHPLASSLEPVAWNALPMRFLGIEIPPLSEGESVELLAAFARRATEAKVFHEVSEGLPGAMLELLRHRTAPLEEMGNALGRCAGPHATALLAIAGLGFATTEGLRLAVGEEGARAGASLLEAGAPVPVFGSLRSGGLWLPGGIARLVEERLGPKHPEVWRRASDIAGMLDELARHFPTENDRVLAARLVVFQHIAPAALQAVFGAEDAETLGRFVRSRGSAYQQTAADNLRLADTLRPLVESYAQGLDDPARASVREKVARVWAERSNEIGAELARSTEELKRMELARDELLKELEDARKQVGRSESDNHNEWRSRVDQDVVRVGASLIANAAGVACFWVALFTDNQRLTFLLLGAILIGIGIGTPALKRGRGPSRAESAAAAAAAARQRRQQERAGQARGVVNMVEARIAGFQQRLGAERHKVEKLRAAAEEPYL